MNLLYSIFFGAGVAGFAYTRIGRRVGYGNTQNVTVTIGVIFVLSTAVFFTVLTTLFNL
jgi:hypothetical protein